MNITNGVTIYIGNTSYHSYNDWGLVITNRNYIGDPVLVTNYVSIPGRSQMIDLSEAVSGRPVFSSRPITINFAAEKGIEEWDRKISAYRNLIDGKQIKLVFDNDPGFFYQGRASITGFDAVCKLGTFTLSIPYADPYKWYTVLSGEDWLWDSFQFTHEDMVTSGYKRLKIDGNRVVTLAQSDAPVVPIVTVLEADGDVTLTANGKTKTLSRINHDYYFPDLLMYQNYSTMEFEVAEGIAYAKITYRKGSL